MGKVEQNLISPNFVIIKMVKNLDLIAIKRLLKRFEIDRAVIFVLLTRGWQLLAGSVSILLIINYLTAELQGFYYTFGSLVALQSFVELGFYLVIINVTSHEWAHLDLDNSGYIIGQSDALSRLVSLGHLIFKWYAVASMIFMVGVSLIGYIFFAQSSQPNIHWQGPWFTLVILTGLLLWVLPFNSLLEGCNQVAVVNKFRLRQAVLSHIALWVVMAIGGGLWAIIVSAAVKLFVDLYLLLIQYRNFFRPFFKPRIGPAIAWRTEIWPMQWRLALSGLVSYFAFSLYNPVMFQYHGAVVAGQMGMTRQIASALQTMSLAWVYTKVPRFGIFISNKDYAALDRYWLRNSLISLAVISGGCGVLWLLLYILNSLHIPLADRLLPPLPTCLYLLATTLMQISHCQSAYLRAHKQEPILVMSVTTGLMTGLLVWFLGSRFGPIGASAGYLGVVIVAVIWETVIWFRCRAEWHQL